MNDRFSATPPNPASVGHPSDSSSIVDVTAQNFQGVIERSRETPVLLEFYAQGAEQSQPTAAMLDKLVHEYQGKFILGRIDVQQNPQVAQQLGVRGLPTVKVIYQGQMAQDLEGPQEESTIREILDQITMSPVERIKGQIELLIADGRRAEAIELLKQVVEQEPGNVAMQVELADLLIMDGKDDQARQMLASLPADAEGISKPKNRLTFIDLAADFRGLAAAQAQVDQDPENLKARFELAVCLVVDDQVEAALQQLLVLLQKDKDFEDELARKTMIQVFDLLGKGDPMATAYRRKMFAFLH